MMVMAGTAAWASVMLHFALAFAPQGTAATPVRAEPEDPGRSGGFAIASSAEWSGDYPRLFPILKEAGIQMVRSFPEWQEIEPAKGKWDWRSSDARVAGARKNGLEIFGCLAYLAPWASATGDTRTFPMKDLKDWNTFSAEVIGRYQNDISYWEVYNEFNGGFAPRGTPRDYAAMVQGAYEAGKSANPKCKVGIGCADVDLSFLEQVIAQGAGGKLDFVVVHPYSLMSAAMSGRETVFLRLAENLRAMLRKTGQRDDLELIVSEVGIQSTNDPRPESIQAEAIVKAFTLSMAQGMSKVFWFEGRGPSYGKEGDFGIVRHDWSKRPSYFALQSLTSLLGARPRPRGWWNPTGKSFGFLFSGATGPVLIAWASSDAGDRVRFPGAVTLSDLAGNAVPLPAGTTLNLSRTPVFVTGLPASLIAECESKVGKPFPWLKDFRQADSVSVQMGASNVEDGLVQFESGDGKTATGLIDGLYARRPLRSAGSEYMYFDVDGSYASVGDKDLEITVVARPVDVAQGAGFNLTYESITGYHESGESWRSSGDAGWQTATFYLHDANFANNWGWNFRIRLSGYPGNVWIKQVTVKRLGAKH
jgi:hypothetical protein